MDGVDFEIYPGETLGLVGESGCGKSTLGRTIINLIAPTGGQVRFRGQLISGLHGEQFRKNTRKMQMIFQDPFSSLNPKKSVRQILYEPFVIHGLYTPQERERRVCELMELVGLDAGFLSRYPHEFSGGQRQRIGIARALALEPEFIICDEAVSALDVSVQAQIINLLERLKQQLGLSYLFIAHNLAVVRHISDRVAVMYLGKLMELAPKKDLYDKPRHPYTQALISAVTIPDPVAERARKPILLSGDPPSPRHPPKGCRFSTRCPYAQDRCTQEEPAFRELESGHFVACHHPL